MGAISRCLDLSRNLLASHDDAFYHQRVKQEKYLLLAFIKVHEEIFNAAGKAASLRVASGDADVAELYEFVERVVSVVSQRYPKLLAYDKITKRHVKIRILPFMHHSQGDDEFWSAFCA
jgi:hypothetical protein